MAKRTFDQINDENMSSEPKLRQMRSEVPVKKKKNKKGAILAGILAGVCVITAGVFGVLAFGEKHEDAEIDNMWDNVREIAGIEEGERPGDQLSGDGTTSNVTASAEEKKDVSSDENLSPDERTYKLQEAYSRDPLSRTVDWDALFDINENVLCWVYIPGTQVNYPVLQEQIFDQAFYLNHSIYGAEQKSGCIFTPAEPNNAEDMHLLLYGHHMKSGSMFGSLTKYKDEAFYKENPYIYLYYPDRTEKWEIWIAEHTKSTDDVYIIPYSYGSVEYDALLRNMEENSLYKTPMFGVNATTNTLVLSTCDHTSRGDNGRFLLGAVQIGSFDPGNGYDADKVNVSGNGTQQVTDDNTDNSILDLFDGIDIMNDSDDDYEGYDVDPEDMSDDALSDGSSVIIREGN